MNIQRIVPQGWLVLSLSLFASASVGCDPGDASEASDADAELGAALAHDDEGSEAPMGLAAASEAAPRHDHGEECSSGERPPLDVQWVAGDGAFPELALDLDPDRTSADRIELQFYLMSLPVTGSGTQPAGEPLLLRRGGRVSMPDALLAAVRGGEAHVAYAMVRACDEPRGECLVRNSGEVFIADGAVFLPEAYQVHLREKWSATRPQLFERGVVTTIIDMNGK